MIKTWSSHISEKWWFPGIIIWFHCVYLVYVIGDLGFSTNLNISFFLTSLSMNLLVTEDLCFERKILEVTGWRPWIQLFRQASCLDKQVNWSHYMICLICNLWLHMTGILKIIFDLAQERLNSLTILSIFVMLCSTYQYPPFKEFPGYLTTPPVFF